ncbi:hypothetical protein GALL_400360 [mine drainage metagenome]|uniref:Uncharacterized protein n=1 Tax=mine drainage metagenome TaxID=410659 RepID=A0A1J5Q3I8_9ZZZZ
MPPYIRELREVGVKVFLGAFFQTAVHQKTQRHGGKGLGADQLAFLPVRQRLAVVTRHDHRHAQRARLDFATPNGVSGRPHGEAGHKVGSTGHGTQADIGFDVRIDVVEAFGREGRSGGHDGAQIRKTMRGFWVQARLAQRLDELGRRAQMGEAHGVGVIEQDGIAAQSRRSVVKTHRGTLAEGGHQPVPHHPAAGREKEHAVVGMDVGLQPQFGQMFEQNTARTMHDALGNSRGAAGVQDVDGMVEWQRGELDRFRLELGQCGVPLQGTGRHGQVERLAQRLGNVRHDQGLRQPGQLPHDVAQLVQHRKCLAVVEVTVAGDEHFGLGLAETVDHPLHAEIGRSRGERRADAGGGEHGDDRLWHVRHVGGDTVALHYTPTAQRLLEARHLGMQRAPSQAAPHAVLAPEMQGNRVVLPAQQVLREIQPGVRKEPGAGHAVGVDQHPVALVLGNDSRSLPHGIPEPGLVGDRPIQQLLVVTELQAVVRIHPQAKGFDMGLRNALRRGSPQRLFNGRLHGDGQSVLFVIRRFQAAVFGAGEINARSMSGSGTLLRCGKSTQTTREPPLA